MDAGNSCEVRIWWTDWLTGKPEEEEHWTATKALYIYGTDEALFRIGIAGRQTVMERCQDNVREGITAEIHSVSNGEWHVKVGHFMNQELLDEDPDLLASVEKLLIFVESHQRGSVLTNKANSKDRGESRPGMVVVNDGAFAPLAPGYHDEG